MDLRPKGTEEGLLEVHVGNIGDAPISLVRGAALVGAHLALRRRHGVEGTSREVARSLLVTACRRQGDPHAVEAVRANPLDAHRIVGLGEG